MSCKSCNDRRMLYLLEKQARRQLLPPEDGSVSDSDSYDEKMYKERTMLNEDLKRAREEANANRTWVDVLGFPILMLLLLGPFVMYPHINK